MFYDFLLPKVIFSPSFLFFSLFPPFSFPFSKPFDYFPLHRGGGIRNNIQACADLQVVVLCKLLLLYVFFTYQLSEAGHTLFIYNIGPDATEIELYGLFGPFGAITKVHIQVQLHSAISVSKQLVM